MEVPKASDPEAMRQRLRLLKRLPSALWSSPIRARLTLELIQLEGFESVRMSAASLAKLYGEFLP